MTLRPSHFVTVALATLTLALMFATAPLRATVLVQLTFNELVAASELIFTGVVTDSSTSVAGDAVYTTVRFEIDEIHAGEYAGDVLELRFLGGISGEYTTDVSGQYIPTVGDRGLYFVDDTARDLVNPLSGWSQGHFPLIDIDGATWLDLKNHPDYGFLEPDADPLAGKMRSLNFTREQIAEQFPERFRFPLNDFLAAIADIRGAQGE
jgi:hypothetical protein